MSDVAAAAPARSRAARWPWLVLVLFVVIALVALVLVVDNGESLAEQVPFVIAFGMFGVVGALILSRMSNNRVGALLLWGSMITALAFLSGQVFTWLLLDGTRSGGLVAVVGLLSNAGWVLGILPVLLFLPMLFPDGRLPSRRWRPLAWLTGTTLVLLTIATTFGLERIEGNEGAPTIANPLYLDMLGGFEVSEAVVLSLLVGCLVGAVASLVVRFRRARGVERQQVKWVVASVALIILSFLVSAMVEGVFDDSNFVVDVLLAGVAFLSLPVAIGIGVLQYRLYDLDVVVKKTLIAGTLVIVVTAAYAGIVAVFGAVASDRESSASLFVLALLLGFAFRPVARVARRFADRLVYGRRATPYEVLAEFSGRVGDAYATEDVLGRMAQILGQGVGAAGARVWLHVGGQLRPASSWPVDAPAVDALDVRGDAIPAVPGEVAVEVRDRGELLGALSVTAPPNDPMTPAKEKLVRDLASQAGLALRNVRLVEELKASQRRIVAAQDQERRRIERNIHDGAQQQLVALTVKMRLAQSLAAKDAEKTGAMLAQMQAETQAALEDLRDLARGIYPPLLADQGLEAALQAQIRKAAIDAELDASDLRRHPQEIESAVYFSVLEALQNVAKYADARHVVVRLRDATRELTFEVADDGRGFDPDATAYGTGLRGIADRLAALDGALDVRSRPGDGTTIVGRVPVAADSPGVPAVSDDADEPSRVREPTSV